MKLKYEETVANIWPNFGTNGKELIKVTYKTSPRLLFDET